MDAAKLKAATTYNAAADHFDDEPLHFWTRIGRRTIDRLELQDGATVLDVGCGAGSSAIHRSWRQIALVIREAVKMAKVTVGVEVIADPLLQLLHVRKAPIRFSIPNDLAIIGDHKDAAGSGLQ